MSKLVFILYAVFVAFVSLRPANGLVIEHWDKVGHFLFYGVFAVLAYPATKHPKLFLYLCIAIVAYGGLMEVAQSFIPGRVMSAQDILANTIGVTVGALFAKQVFSSKHV